MKKIKERVEPRQCRRNDCRAINNGICTYDHDCRGRWIKPKKNRRSKAEAKAK